MIIDGDSFANIASDTLMKKLNLSCIKHPRPYRLQWFNKCGEVKITKQVYDDQMKLKKECEDEKSENSCEDNCERRSSDLAKSKSLVKLVESGGKTRGVKKVSLCDDNSVEKLKKQPNFDAKGAEIRYVFFTNKLMIFYIRRLILTLTILILLFLVWLFLCCRSLMMYFLKTSLVDYHH